MSAKWLWLTLPLAYFGIVAFLAVRYLKWFNEGIDWGPPSGAGNSRRRT